MLTDTVRVAIVGAGRQGMRRLQAIQELGEDDVVIVADLNGGAAEVLARKAECSWTTEWHDAVSAAVQAVVVCVPPNLHVEITQDAFQHGCHVLCEKPLAMTSATAWSLVAMAKRTGCILKCGFNYRHHPAIAQAKTWVSEGRVGRITIMRCTHGTGGRPNFEREWRTQLDYSGGGILMDQGIHVLDLFRWFGGSFSTVTGRTVTNFWPIAPVEDNAFAILRGVDSLASLHVSWTLWKNEFSLELIGSDGVIRVVGLGGSYGVERAILVRWAGESLVEQEVVEFRGPDRSWDDEWQEFKSAVVLEQEPVGGGHDGAEALTLVEAIYRSSRERRIVSLEPAATAVPAIGVEPGVSLG